VDGGPEDGEGAQRPAPEQRDTRENGDPAPVTP
jgi:hypothetical protein